MKKLLLICVAVIGLAGVSRAQGGGGGGGRGQQRSPEDQTAALKTSLALTDDQAAKVLAIYKTAKVSNDSLATAANGDRAAMRAGRAPITAATNAKLALVLTPEQAATMKKQQEEMRARMQQGGGGMGGGGGTPPPPTR
jgi:protein CpxP